MQRIKDFIRNNFSVLSVIGLILGALGGYAYYYYIGCTSGTCPIKSNPYLSITWGGLLGYLVFDIFRKKKPADKNQPPL